MSKPIVYNVAKAERQIAELKQSIEELKIGEIGYQARISELKAENEKLKEENKDLRFETVRSFERGQKFPCNLNCENCTEKCRAWQNGFNAKGGNLSFDSVMMLRRIVEEVTPEWYDNNCISCAWFNNLKGVGGYCAYHNKKTTAKGGCNKWAKECDTDFNTIKSVADYCSTTKECDTE